MGSTNKAFFEWGTDGIISPQEDRLRAAGWLAELIDSAVEKAGTLDELARETGLRADALSKSRRGTVPGLFRMHELESAGLVPNLDAVISSRIWRDHAPYDKPPLSRRTTKRKKAPTPPPAKEPAALTGVVEPPKITDVFDVIAADTALSVRNRQTLSALVALMQTGIEVHISIEASVRA